MTDSSGTCAHHDTGGLAGFASMDLTAWRDCELVAPLLNGSAGSRAARAAALCAQIGTVAGLRSHGQASLERLGMTCNEARRLLSALELGRRASRGLPTKCAITDAHSAYACVRTQLLCRDRERFVVMLLDIKNRPRQSLVVAEGSVDGCAVDLREIFGPAVRERASNILVAHNHPSGDPTPSAEDLRLTERLSEAGRLVGIPVLDHLIVCDELEGGTPNFVSLAGRHLK
jgi:DNA repair protein RadC